MNTHIVFSAFGYPDDNPLLASLEPFKSTSVTVITARKFAASWRQSGVDVFVCKGNPMSLISRVVRQGANRLSTRFGMFFGVSRLLSFGFLKWHFMVPHNLRHFAYLEVVKSFSPSDLVFCVDSRDLIFQLSPIDIASTWMMNDQVHVFDEGKRYFKGGCLQTFERSAANLTWVQDLLGVEHTPDFLIGDAKFVINSGCIAGSSQKLIELFTVTTQLLSGSPNSIWGLLDQAALNVAIYGEDRLKQGNVARIHPNGEVVLNMCGVIDERVDLIEGKLIRGDRAIPIVHQFDRFGIYSGIQGLNLSRRDYKVN